MYTCSRSPRASFSCCWARSAGGDEAFIALPHPVSSVDGALVGRVRGATDEYALGKWRRLAFGLPSRLSRHASVTLSVHPAWSPSDLLANGDTRALGVAVAGLRLTEHASRISRKSDRSLLR